MDTLFNKTLFLIGTLFILLVQQSKAQDGCYNCSTDSLGRTLNLAKTDPERAKIITLLIDLRVSGVGSEADVKRDSVVLHDVESLIDLSNSVNVKNIDAYRSLSDRKSTRLNSSH